MIFSYLVGSTECIVLSFQKLAIYVASKSVVLRSEGRWAFNCQVVACLLNSFEAEQLRTFKVGHQTFENCSFPSIRDSVTLTQLFIGNNSFSTGGNDLTIEGISWVSFSIDFFKLTEIFIGENALHEAGSLTVKGIFIHRFFSRLSLTFFHCFTREKLWRPIGITFSLQ